MRLIILTVFVLVAAVGGIEGCSKPRSDSEGADLIEKAISKNIGWHRDLVEAVRCIAPHKFVKGEKYAFDDKAVLYRGTGARECKMVRDSIREVCRRWIKRDPAEREIYVGEHQNPWSIFTIYVIPSYTGSGRLSGGREENMITEIKEACDKAHGQDWGRRRNGLDMELAPWLERDFNAWKHEQKSGSCGNLAELSGEQLLAKLVGLLNRRFAVKAREVVETLSCVVPFGENLAREGGKIPLKGANCKSFNYAVAGIAHRIVKDSIVSMSSGEYMFREVFAKAGIPFKGDDLVDFGHMVNACSEKRPYRDWGTTNKDAVDTFRVTLKTDPNLPTDIEHSNNFRVQMFCLHGIDLRQTDFNLRPGESSTLLVGFNKYGVSEGVSCQLNRGLSSVRTYDINDHVTTCVSSNLFLRRMRPDLPYHVVVDKDSCPYSWVLDKQASSDNHAVVVLKMKSQVEQDGGVLNEPNECAVLREQNTDAMSKNIAKVYATKGRAEIRGKRVAHLFKCLVPMKRVGNLKARRKEANCDLLINAMGKLAHKIALDGREGPSGLAPSVVDDALAVVKNANPSFKDMTDSNRWALCRNPLPRRLWGDYRGEVSGPIIAVKVYVDRRVPKSLRPEDSPRINACLHGLLVEEDGTIADRQKITRIRGARHVALNKYNRPAGLSCALPMIQKGGCLYSASAVKYSPNMPWQIVSDSHGVSNCPLHWVIKNGGASSKKIDIVLSKK